MSAERTEFKRNNRFWEALYGINYLTVRMTVEGEEALRVNGIVQGRVWVAADNCYIGLKLVRDPNVSFIETSSYPDSIDRKEIEGWTVSLSEEMTERLLSQQITGADQASGTSLRQVKVVPSSKADEIF